MGIEALKIPRTMAVYDYRNISKLTLDAMKSFPQPYIIKPTHTSGGVARVKDDKYACIKGCINEEDDDENSSPVIPLGDEAFKVAREQVLNDLELDHSVVRNELQYRDIPHQIIVEEDIQVGDIKTDVSYWYSANGRPLFASLQCNQPTYGEIGTEAERIFVSTDFKKLNLKLSKDPCSSLVKKPKTWERQVAIASALAKHVPGIVRIDLYAGEENIYFSEFTYTTAFCGETMGFRPRVGDGLLHAVQHNVVHPTRATADFIENTIHDDSWVFVSLANGRTLHPERSNAFPSPVDLCESVLEPYVEYIDRNWQNDAKVKQCLTVARDAAASPLRCVHVVGSSESKYLGAISAQKEATFWSVLERVDWGRALTLWVLVTVLSYTGVGTARRKNQYLNNLLYLVAMGAVMYFTTPNIEGVFSSHSLFDIVEDCFTAFYNVHPMESPYIAVSHFATYWLFIASWRSKSFRNLLLWNFLIETITASVNEYAHHIEEQNVVRCSRMVFISSMKHYAFDNLIREYVVGTFFVYGYLLPTFVLYWTTSGTSNMGLVVLCCSFAVVAMLLWGAYFLVGYRFPIRKRKRLGSYAAIFSVVYFSWLGACSLIFSHRIDSDRSSPIRPEMHQTYGKPSSYYWKQLPEEMKVAATILGFDKKSWNKDKHIPAYDKTTFDQDETEAIKRLGLEKSFQHFGQ